MDMKSHIVTYCKQWTTLKILRNSGHEENVRPARHRVIPMRNSTSVTVFPHTSAMQYEQTLQDIYQNN